MDIDKIYNKYEKDIKKSLKNDNLDRILLNIVHGETEGVKDLVEKLENGYQKIDDLKSQIKTAVEPLLYLENYQFKLYSDFLEINVSEDRSSSNNFIKQIEDKLKEGQLNGIVVNDESEPALEEVWTNQPLIGFPLAPRSDGKYPHSIESETITNYRFIIRINYTNEFKNLCNEFKANWKKLEDKDKYIVRNYEALFDECKKRFGFFDKLHLHKIKPNFEDVRIFPQNNLYKPSRIAEDRFYPFSREDEVLEGS